MKRLKVVRGVRWFVVLAVVATFHACGSESRNENGDESAGGADDGEAGQPVMGGAGGTSAGTNTTSGKPGRGGGSSGGDGAGGSAGSSANGGDAPSGGSGDTGGSAGASGGLGGNAASAGSGGDAMGGGTGGSSGAGGSSTAGTGGAAGSSSGGCGNLIDDMEAGTGYICQGNGRTGSWFSYLGPRSTLSPMGSPVPTSLLPAPRGTSTRGMNISGTNGDYAGFGCWLRTVPATYDATGYTGIRFWAMGGPATLRVFVQTSATESTEYGGRCTLPTLSCAGNETSVSITSTWTQYSVPFSVLSGGTVTFTQTDIWSIEFQSPNSAGTYSIWIDDLSFY